MYLIAIAWIYVALLMAVAEATHANGSVLGALVTFFLYGVGPLALVMYLLGSPVRRRARREEEAQADAAAAAEAEAAAAAAAGASDAARLPPSAVDLPEATASGDRPVLLDPDRGGHAATVAAASPVTPVGKEA